jgi:hypothetical protein
MAMEPGRAGSSASEAKELPTSYSSEFGDGTHRSRGGAAGVATHHGLPARKGSSSRNPRSGSGRRELARPEGEQTVEGVRNPEGGPWRVRQARDERLPPVEVAEGEPNPRRGDPVRQDRGGRRGPNPERAAKPVEAAGRSSDRSACRSMEHLAAVETAWRGRRTDDAATSAGALREVRKP